MGKNTLKLSVFFISLMLFASLPLFCQDDEGAPVLEKALFFVMEDSSNNYQIARMGLKGENKQILTSQGSNWAPAVSYDGRMIAFYSNRSGFTNLYVMRVDGNGQKQLTFDTDNITGIDLRNRGQIMWDKEIKDIIFLKKGDIWKTDIMGYSPSALTKHHDVTMFKTDPDCKKIAFTREITKRHNGLWTMLIDGTSVRQIASSDVLLPAFDWADSTTIGYFFNRGFYSINHIGIENKIITDTFYHDNEISWSKLSQDRLQNMIAYIDDEGGMENIWLVKGDGTGKRKLTEDGGASPAWMPDAKNIIYVQGPDIYSVNIDSKDKNRLTFYLKAYYPLVADVIQVPKQPSEDAVKK